MECNFTKLMELTTPMEVTTPVELTTPMEYWQIAKDMSNQILTIRDSKQDDKTKMNAVGILRKHLVNCILDENLSKLTALYQDKKEMNLLGYDPMAVSTFVGQMLMEYPEPDPLDNA